MYIYTERERENFTNNLIYLTTYNIFTLNIMKRLNVVEETQTKSDIKEKQIKNKKAFLHLDERNSVLKILELNTPPPPPQLYQKKNCKLKQFHRMCETKRKAF